MKLFINEDKVLMFDAIGKGETVHGQSNRLDKQSSE